ncbi:hypothetical protein ACO1KB_15360 [Leptospira interrogans serovar Szwajizak]|uniref:hypothetical protein n=1 Tax=Leptospira interrogans TaxID=173 RepID=UPI003CF1767D
MTEISKDLGISLNTLINWKKKYLTDDGPFQDELRAENERLRKELLEVTEEGEILKKVRSHLLETKEMKYTYIEKNHFPIQKICKILNVSKSGFAGRKVLCRPFIYRADFRNHLSNVQGML